MSENPTPDIKWALTWTSMSFKQISALGVDFNLSAVYPGLTDLNSSVQETTSCKDYKIRKMTFESVTSSVKTEW